MKEYLWLVVYEYNIPGNVNYYGRSSITYLCDSNYLTTAHIEELKKIAINDVKKARKCDSNVNVAFVNICKLF